MMALPRAISKNARSILEMPKMQKRLQVRNAGQTTSTLVYKDKDLDMMHRHFRIANRDVYKKLNMAEFNKLVALTTGRKLDDVDLRLIYRTMDLNRDEYVSYSEVEKHFEKSLTTQPENVLAFAFCRFDKDQNERISLHEFKEALFYLGYLHSGHCQVKEFFEKQDKDGDKQINFKEFVHILKEDMPKLIV